MPIRFLTKLFVLLLLLTTVGCATTRLSKVTIDIFKYFSAQLEFEQITPVIADKTGWTEISDSVRYWSTEGNVLAGNEYLTIASDTGRGQVLLISPELTGPGVYLLTADIKAENVTRVGSAQFNRGKFQGVVYIGGTEVAWPESDFTGSFDWSKKSLEVHVKKGETLRYRIGLQEASGRVFVRDIHVFKKSE